MAPVAIFALGPFHDEEEEWKEVRARLDKELEKFPLLTPIVTEIFGGKYDEEKLRFPDNIILKLPGSPLHNMPATDIRDWKAIRDWESKLAAQFQPPWHTERNGKMAETKIKLKIQVPTLQDSDPNL
ncbi:flavodoxin [Methanosarcina siciliae HI350]|uniref:Flavodoxin n=1 Tax=Methanosarcina siciliae HI350 TaxID=1434119 RepID=A0A0E3LAQ1_9EURY|nr:hypothetical protein [Methanosarcina siciliae]AKB32411.1 flavodoxin [Methanosarcina siciliae HI350]